MAYAAALGGVYSCAGLCCMPSRSRLGAVVICVLSGLWRIQGALLELGRAKVMQVALDTWFREWEGVRSSVVYRSAGAGLFLRFA